MKVTCFETVELSDVGRKRKNNEDACLRVPDKGMYCVADGMGGVVGGHLASAAIVSRLRRAFIEAPPDDPETFVGHVALFRKATNAANKWIRDFAEEKAIGQMGSTVLGLIFDPENPRRAVALHAGDSRLYRYRNGQLQLLTSDHTAAQALAVQLGRDISKIPEKFHNELVRAVGLAEKLELEKTEMDVRAGDVFLLCSDGLTKMMDEAAIAKVLEENNVHPLSEAAQTLITNANEAGGKDNVTVILIRVGDLTGFSEVLAPVNLDEPKTSSGGPTLETEQFTPPKTKTPDTVHADTPSDDFGSPGREDTPNTVNQYDPRTPATVIPRSSLDTELRKPLPLPESESKRSLPIGVILAMVLVVSGVAGYLLFRPKSKVAAPVSPVAAPVQISAPAAPVVAPTGPGTLKIKSDPPRAEVFVGGESVGETPLSLDVPAGQTKVVLKVDGLKDQVASLTVQSARVHNVVAKFEYGSVIIDSTPEGASVAQNSQVLGYTPYTNNLVAAGPSVWNVAANGFQPRSVSIDVLDHKTVPLNVSLQRGRGVLHLTGNLPGITARVDGAAMGALPLDVAVDAGVDHTVIAEYKSATKSSGPVRVNGSATIPVSFSFNDEPPPPSKWTDKVLGLDFVKLPGGDAWIAVNRVTLDQFNRLMGADGAGREAEDGGQRYVVNISAPAVLDFASKATDAARQNGELSGALKNYHFALPTAQQWQQGFSDANQLGIQIADFKKDKEWCRDGNAWSMAGYVLLGENANPEPGHKPINPPPGDKPRQFAIRLVLEP